MTMLNVAFIVVFCAAAHGGDESVTWWSSDATTERFVFKQPDTTPVLLWRRAEDVGRACKHTRAELVIESLRYLDADDDGCVSLDEMQEAFERCLSWYERVGMRLGRIFGAVHTPETTMNACDRNDDALMCIDDIARTNTECELEQAPHCLCDCEAIDEMFHYILSREPCA